MKNLFTQFRGNSAKGYEHTRELIVKGTDKTVDFGVILDSTVGELNFDIVGRDETVSTLAGLPLSGIYIGLWIWLTDSFGKVDKEVPPHF